MIQGEQKLPGTLPVQGAKNSVLPILAAAILAEGEVVLENCPDLSDVAASFRIMEYLECDAKSQGS
ncbi:UDP-N-acetylglucosamine 1-carboxyvinyltransferase, partial [Akkermansia muciniphila]